VRVHVLAWALTASLGLGCATAGSRPPSVGLRIEGNAPDATVWIDDRLVGRLADFSTPPRRLMTGFHRIEVRAPGYYSSFREVDAKPGVDLVIRAELHELVQ
jgi:PEGA domain